LTCILLVHSISDIQFSSLRGQAPDYLAHNPRGRDYFGRVFQNTGTCYGVGVVGGGLYGGLNGFRQAPKKKIRVRVNGLLNGLGKMGSRTGNMFGALGLIYTNWEFIADTVEVDTYIGRIADTVVPITSGVATGMLYKCMAGPKTSVLAGVIGGATMTVMHFVVEPLMEGRQIGL
jgi:import inner membrane translocase subunit TIM23